MTALLGKRIVCTGATGSESSLVDFLTSHGAEVLTYPCIAIAPVADPSKLDATLAAATAGAFTWVCFTSTNAVEQVADRLQALGMNHPRARIAAIGTSTATSLQDLRSPPHPRPRSTGDLPSPACGRGAGDEGGAGSTNLVWSTLLTSMPVATSIIEPSSEKRGGGKGITVDFIPTTFTAAALAAELPINPGDTVLIPQADIAAPTLAEGLRERGASVTTVDAYQTTTGCGGVDLPGLLFQRFVDAVLFASPSAVHGCVERFDRQRANPELLARVPVVCIGPVTAEAARGHGLTNLVVASEHTRSGMANALIAEFSAHREGIRA